MADFATINSQSSIALADSFSGEMLFRTKLGPQNIDAIVDAARTGLLYDVTPGDLISRIELLQERIDEFEAKQETRHQLLNSTVQSEVEEGGRLPDRSAHLARMKGELPLLLDLQERLNNL